MIGGYLEKCVKEWRPILKYRSICMGNLSILRTLESACQRSVLTTIGFFQNVSHPGYYQVMSSPIAFVVFNWMALFCHRQKVSGHSRNPETGYSE